MPRTAVSVPFSVRKEDQERLQRLIEKFGSGSPSEFLRIAMDRMEVAERAEKLRWLQDYGARRAAESGLADVDVHEAVRKTLNRGVGGPDARSRRLVARVLRKKR